METKRSARAESARPLLSSLSSLLAQVRQYVCEAVERAKTASRQAADADMPVRYKQVYVLDLSKTSVMDLAGNSKAADMTKAIIGLGNEFYPETMCVGEDAAPPSSPSPSLPRRCARAREACVFIRASRRQRRRG